MTKEVSRDWSRITVTNDVAYLPIVLNYVKGVAEHLKFSEANQRKIELAVDEAVMNVIEHAFEPGEINVFDVTCRRLPEGLEISLHDNGLPYDPALIPDFTKSPLLDDVSDKGLGSLLIKELMDEFEFKNLGSKGKETRFVKYYDSRSVLEGKADHPPEIPHSDEEEKSNKTVNFTIRLMRPEEAIEVSRCVYDSYGYSYANEHIYYPERVAAMNASGDLRSAVAVTDSGEVGGHFALIVYKRLPAEIGIAVTKKKFRGQKIAARLGEFLDEEAKKMGMKGLQVREVTVHPYTQKFCQKLGYKDCGFLLAHSPTTMSFKGIADELAQRNTDVVGYKYFDAPAERTIHPPKRHRAMVESLYANMNVPIQTADAGTITKEHSKVDIAANSVRSVCEIHVNQSGRDIATVLKHELRTMRVNEIKVAEMYLNLMDPATPIVVEEAEKLGFFFTGILPETDGSDSLIMQFLNGIHIDYDVPVIVSDTAKELLAYIRENDPYL